MSCSVAEPLGQDHHPVLHHDPQVPAGDLRVAEQPLADQPGRFLVRVRGGKRTALGMHGGQPSAGWGAPSRIQASAALTSSNVGNSGSTFIVCSTVST